MHRRTNPRGNAMLVTMIALAVLMVLVVGALRFTGANREGAAAKNKGDIAGACADAARKHLMSKFKTFMPVANLTLNSALPDHQTPSERSQMLTAHYDSTAPTPTIVSLSAQAMGQARNQVADVANRLAGTTLGGSYYRVVVKCRDPNTQRESELEFTFRHGI